MYVGKADLQMNSGTGYGYKRKNGMLSAEVNLPAGLDEHFVWRKKAILLKAGKTGSFLQKQNDRMM
jgi:hypothetical protein